jgi:hypothetical protein
MSEAEDRRLVLISRRWRVGRKLGRTLYAILRDEPSDDDVLIGLMDTEALAAAVVIEHNVALEPRG